MEPAHVRRILPEQRLGSGQIPVYASLHAVGNEVKQISYTDTYLKLVSVALAQPVTPCSLAPSWCLETWRASHGHLSTCASDQP